MNYANILAVLIMVAVTSLAVVMISGTDSFAQNDTTSMDNQSSGAVNDTAMENVTGSGSISGCIRGTC